MVLDVKVPSVGESIVKGMLAAWLQQDGETVSEGADLFELETDKATMAVPAPASGVLKIAVAAGIEVAIGQVVGSIDEAAAVVREPPAAQAAPVTPPATAAPASRPEASSLRAPTPTAAPSPEDTTRKPLSAIRRRIAEKLVTAQRNTAYLSTMNEVDMEIIIACRSKYKEDFERQYGIKLGFMSFFVKACCRALRDVPEANAMIEGEDVVYRRHCHIGVAVSTDRGLLVPVIRNAELLGIAGIETAVADLAARARKKKIMPADLAGGTFSITNGGVFGSLLSTPLPNYPQTAILGMHAIQRRPVAVGEQIVIRSMMYLALTYDHRLLDGREAIGFLRIVKESVEDPVRLLLDA